MSSDSKCEEVAQVPLERPLERHVVGRVADIPSGSRKVVNIRGREIVIFNIGGEFFAIANRCPHEGAKLCTGALVGQVESGQPGEYRYHRRGELLRCPWHGWEFDLRTGRSYCDPNRVRVRAYPVSVEAGQALVAGPYVAETFAVDVEDDYVILKLKA